MIHWWLWVGRFGVGASLERSVGREVRAKIERCVSGGKGEPSTGSKLEADELANDC